MALAESLEGFLAKLHDVAKSLGVTDRQRVLRLVVKEVRVGPESIVIRHSIPLPGHHPTWVIYCVQGNVKTRIAHGERQDRGGEHADR